MTQSSHIHHFIPPRDPTRAPLVLLHGSGGDEHDLVPLADELAPGSAMLGVRGTVAIDSGFTFFHRFLDRTIDEADIIARIPILSDFIEAAGTRYSFTRTPIAIGFPNGAIMAAVLLLTCPSLLAGAIPFRPLSPFTHDLPTCLDGIPVLSIDGEKDSRRLPGDGARLAERLVRADTTVTHYVLPAGHTITMTTYGAADAFIPAVETDPSQCLWR